MVKVKNEEIAKGVNKYGRSQMISKSGRWRFFKKGAEAKKKEKEPRKVEKTGVKKVKRYGSKYYDPEVARKPKRANKRKQAITKLRKSVTPGAILIILAGRFRGKRVIFLKQLESGLLLVTGPYKINGVPLRRINQAYVIGTSTKVDISKIEIPTNIDDKYFARVKSEKKETTTKEEEFLNKQSKSKVIVNQEWLQKRTEGQKAVDTPLLEVVKQTPLLEDYLRAKFSLTKHQAPHKMVF